MTTPAPFTPPRSCSTSWRATGNYFQVGASCSSGTLINDPSCLPAATSGACPYNWRPVTTGSLTTCCPAEFNLASTTTGWCYSSAGGFVLTGFTCAPSANPTGVTATYGFTPGVWVRAASFAARVTSSIPSSTPASSSTPRSASSTPISSATNPSSTPDIVSKSSTTTSAPPAPPSPDPGLSAGAIAGIVIGSVLGVALILAALILLRKRRAKVNMAPEHQSFIHPPQSYQDTKVELDAGAAGRYAHTDPRMSQMSHQMSPVSPMPPHQMAPHMMAQPVELESHSATQYTNYR